MKELNRSKGLAKRIVPCLDVKNGEPVKGTNFVNLRSAGDPVELGKAYSDAGADELVFLDITASFEERKTFTDMVLSDIPNSSVRLPTIMARKFASVPSMLD